MLDLKPKYLAMLREILAQHCPEMKVWAYGSRVQGLSHDGSDLDLVIRHPTDLTQPQQNLAEIREALIESDIPILVEILDWALIPESFQQEIIKKYVVIQ